MLNNGFRSQKGVGLMEVLVSMLILSVAILGFVALQVRATTATEEALKRSDALIILHGLAERIRLNSTGDYKATIPTTTPACMDEDNCDADEQAQVDLYLQSQVADTKNIELGVTDCPNTSSNQARLCLIAAWDMTSPVIDNTTDNRCINSSDGKYADNSTCLVLEAY